MLVTNQWILPRILGMSDIYIGEWSDRYGYILYIFASGWRLEITGKTLFFPIFLFPTVNIV